MEITHSKVSGIPNGDPEVLGGEDWDAAHIVAGPVVVDFVSLWLTTGGAITSASYYLLGFAKTGTGTYRAIYDPADFNGGNPRIVASISTPSGAPRFVRVTLTNDGDDQIVELVTTDATGAAVDVASGTLSLVAGAVF